MQDNTQNEIITFSELQLALHRGDADYDASESQAIACGMLVVNMSADKLVWVKLLVGDIDAENKAQHEAIAMLGKLFEQTKYQLQDSGLDFNVLLPDDDVSLSERVNAIQEWCHGFLLGISLAGVKDHSSLPEDSRDLLVDIASIGSSGDFDFDEEDGEDSESEEALIEIVEYLRMGALLINEELQPIKSSTVIH